MNYAQMDRQELYLEGLDRSRRFLDRNGILRPLFCQYKDVETSVHNEIIKTFFRRATTNGVVQGTGTGLYYAGCVFVNVPRTALPVLVPSQRSWSWPGYKVDRTPIGVVAHEVGHYIEDCLRRLGRLTAEHSERWRDILKANKKAVSGYEPVPSEAWAESMRLFILNPNLLSRGLPARYAFIESLGLIPGEKRGWKQVLDNDAYNIACERWIGDAK